MPLFGSWEEEVGRDFSLSSMSMMLGVIFSEIPIVRLRELLSFPSVLRNSQKYLLDFDEFFCGC